MDVLYLFHRYRDDVYRLAVNDTRSLQDAETVSQTVFLKLIGQTDLLPGREKAWLMQMTANVCRDRRHAGWWKRREALEPALEIPCTRENETISLLRQLQPQYRVVVYLHYYEQYTTPEISQLLKMPARTVSARLRRTRVQLNIMLKEGRTMKQKLNRVYDDLTMPDECTCRIEQAMQRELEKKERVSGVMDAVYTPRQVSGRKTGNIWGMAAAAVLLVLVFSVVSVGLMLHLSERHLRKPVSAAVLSMTETIVPSMSGNVLPGGNRD